MRKVQQRGLLSVVGLLGVVLLGLVGCGGASGDGDSAGRTSRVTLQITTAEQTGGDTLRQAIFPSSLRAVPTDPSDPAFVSRLDIEVTGEGISTPITQSVDLTAAQQEAGVAVDLTVPTGQQRRITVNAFNAADTRIFNGDTTVDLLGAAVTVPLTLHRLLVPEAVTPAALANKVFAFTSTAAFGIAGAATLQFGSFTDTTGPFTLTAAGQTATGTVTLLPPASASTTQQSRPVGTPRQGETSPSCQFSVATSTLPANGAPQAGQTLLMQPCETDALDGNLILVNTATGLSSTSEVPTEAVVPGPIPPNTLRISSPAGPVTRNQTFPVVVEFNSSATNVITYLIELKFNPAVIVVTGITKGSQGFDDPITNPAAFSTESVKFAANNSNFSPVSGLVTLANIAFQVVGNAGDTSELSLDFPATPGGNGIIVSDAFEPITIATIIPGAVVVQ